MTIGILTSGGDAPGMNAVIAGACDELERLGGRALGVRSGFAGLASRDAEPITALEARTHLHEPGTWLGTSRWPELRDEQGRAACREAVQLLGLGGLLVIGGDGSAKGGRVLADTLPVAVVPATIDQDIDGTDLTIGMDSAIGYAMDAIDRLRITGRSLRGRAFLVQTLGAPNGFLADAVAAAAGIDDVLVPERGYDLDALAVRLRELSRTGAAIAVMSEAVGDAVRIAEALAARAGVRVHPTILGHAQRAATPSALDRALGQAAGRAAADALARGESAFIRLMSDGSVAPVPLTLRPATPAVTTASPDDSGAITTPVILAVGEALMEFRRATADGRVDTPGAWAGPFPSGAPAIFASVAARLGAPSALAACVGGDAYGRALIERLRRDGVDDAGIRLESRRATPIAFVAYRKTGERDFWFSVHDSAAMALEVAVAERLAERADWLHVSGSTLGFGGPLALAVEAAAARVLARGGRLSLDPNVRSDADADLRARIAVLADAAHVLFPSEGELAALGLDAGELAGRGAVVCETRGRHGALLFSGPAGSDPVPVRGRGGRGSRRHRCRGHVRGRVRHGVPGRRGRSCGRDVRLRDGRALRRRDRRDGGAGRTAFRLTAESKRKIPIHFAHDPWRRRRPRVRGRAPGAHRRARLRARSGADR